jgi:hypothetical protein
MKKISFTRRNAIVALGAGLATATSTAGFAASAVSTESGSLEASVEALRRALEEGDGAALNELLHEHLTYSHSDARVWSKEVLLSNVAGKKRYLSIVNSEQSVDLQGPTGIVRNTCDVANNDEKKSRSHIKVLMCWIRTDKSWQLLARSGTNAPV